MLNQNNLRVNNVQKNQLTAHLFINFFGNLHFYQFEVANSKYDNFYDIYTVLKTLTTPISGSIRPNI